MGKFTVQVDQERIQEHLGEMARSTAEETLNTVLDADAEQLCQAGRDEHTDS